MLTEREIRELVQGVGERRPMTEDARLRVRSRLGLEPTSPVLVTTTTESVATVDDPAAHGAVLDASARVDAGSSSQSRRPRKTAWMAAAVFVLLAGLGFAARGARDSGDVSTVADQAVVATPTPAESVTQPTVVAPAPVVGPAFCAGVFTDFIEVIENWRGLDNWSRLVDGRHPEPHLPTFAEAVLDELVLIAGDPEAAAELEQFTSAIADIDRPQSNSTYRDEWRQPVERVVSFLAQTVDSNSIEGVDFGACDSEALVSAAAGP